VSEVDVHIDMKVYRTVARMPLGTVTSDGLRALVSRRLISWGQKSPSETWSLQYKNKDGELRDVTDNFPDDTDGGWREFFAAVFYVDFVQDLGGD
jgi:hypothetical protein